MNSECRIQSPDCYKDPWEPVHIKNAKTRSIKTKHLCFNLRELMNIGDCLKKNNE